jgi:catalase (peroxidase I)
VFGPSSAGSWTVTGRDDATPEGAMFGNFFHSYLKVDIVEDTAAAFASNILAFDQDLGDWFRESGRQINHLDTDVTMAFPSVDTSFHPDFHTFTSMFADDNDLFMTHFEAAFRKMTMLGVNASQLVDALPCSAGCAGTPVKLILTAEAENTVFNTVQKAVEEADIELAETLVIRAPLIVALTTPVAETFAD